jgi:hypothetical protein
LIQAFKIDFCYGGEMAKDTTNSDKPNSDTGPIFSPASTPSSYVVNNPLSASRIAWLRQQSKHVAAVRRQRLSEREESPALD